MLNEDYGHWSIFEKVNINEYLGFVYVIEFDDGKKYVGAKKIWKRIKTPPASFKRGPKKGFEESDWRTYTSSSREVNALISSGVNPKKYIIVGWYNSWGKTLMAEMEMQLANDVLRNENWMNKQIGGHFNPNCYDDLSENDIKRWLEFDKGNEHVNWPAMYKLGQKTKYVNPEKINEYLLNGWQFGRSKSEKHSVKTSIVSYTLWDYHNNISVEVKNQSQFAKDNNLKTSHLSHLLKGNLDLIEKRWGLHPEIARQRYRFIDVKTGIKFLTNNDAEQYYGVNRGGINSLLKSGKIKKLIIESKSEYVIRLKSMELVKRITDVNTSIIMENTFKDIANPLSDEEKNDMIKWLESYIDYLKIDHHLSI